MSVQIETSQKGIKGPASKGVAPHVKKDLDEMSEREARRELARLAEEDDDEYEYANVEKDPFASRHERLAEILSDHEDGDKIINFVTMMYKEQTYWLFGSPNGNLDNVLFKGRYSVYMQPLVQLCRLLIATLSLDNTSDITLNFHNINLRFPHHMVYTHQVTLERVVQYHSVLAEKESRDSLPISFILELTKPSFESRYSYLEGLCAGLDSDGGSSHESSEYDYRQEGKYSVLQTAVSNPSPSAGLLDLEYAVETVEERDYTETGDVTYDAEEVGALFDDGKRKASKKPRL